MACASALRSVTCPRLVGASSVGKMVKPSWGISGYGTEDDRRTIIDGTRVALEIASRPALRNVRTADWAVPESDSDADILAFARYNTRTVFHPVGTGAMGPVVDAELRVHGVERLRVVDASVMPTVPRGNTNTP